MIYRFCGISLQNSGEPYRHLHIETDNVTQVQDTLARNYQLIPIGQVNSKYHSITSISNRTEVVYA
ncbi:hypothetical protein BKG94_07190 [Rodentibacter ratti]|uniref:hypothetical protein n=1 Tax=Rodentibacter ratti TaxID=1906745 RepID=UPI0009855714|nr:hypothetical protein [Rodentibacter ratti]OOF88308.1 hypothetical protein BKG94_07190 [Rodentibacter ratti]